jgi:acetoin utilization deacetylase AcuC-like enzyme
MKTLKVFYHPDQTVKDNNSFSPSAGKPALVLKSWQGKGLPIEVIEPKPLTASQIALAHDPAYVHDILTCKASNGFGNTLPSVAKALRYTTGSMVAAAFHAVRFQEPAASLSSGFHHSCYASGGGFCTFNGLIIAAQMLRLKGLAKQIGIIDCDQHHSNGVLDIIKKLGLEESVKLYDFGSDPMTAETSDDWLRRLPKIVTGFKDCDVILYQAGADPHLDDPLGGRLSSVQLRLRDRIVFSEAKKMGIPVAFCLAGGYQNPIRKVLDIHDATAIECLRVYGKKSG